MSQTFWSLIALLESLENVFSTLTGQKFEILFFLGLPLSSDINYAVSAFSGKTSFVILVLMAFVSQNIG